MFKTQDTQLFLLSNFDVCGGDVLDMIHLDGKRVLMVETAMIGEGRSLSDTRTTLPYELRDAQIRIIDFSSESADVVRAEILDSDIIHFCGGNTFFLLDAILASGAKTALAEREMQGGLICIGESAGAIIFGLDIAHISSLDDPTAAPDLATTCGLEWYDGYLVPHCKADAWDFGARIDAWLAQEPDPDRYTLLHENAFLHITPNGGTLIGPSVTR